MPRSSIGPILTHMGFPGPTRGVKFEKDPLKNDKVIQRTKEDWWMSSKEIVCMYVCINRDILKWMYTAHVWVKICIQIRTFSSMDKLVCPQLTINKLRSSAHKNLLTIYTICKEKTKIQNSVNTWMIFNPCLQLHITSKHYAKFQ